MAKMAENTFLINLLNPQNLTIFSAKKFSEYYFKKFGVGPNNRTKDNERNNKKKIKIFVIKK